MSDGRRRVRATSAFFDDLEAQLAAERGSRGEPSVNDFQSLELLRIVEAFATGFDELPELIPGRPDYRLLILAGTLVSRFSVLGQLASDGAVELISLEIDLKAD